MSAEEILESVLETVMDTVDCAPYEASLYIQDIVETYLDQYLQEENEEEFIPELTCNWCRKKFNRDSLTIVDLMGKREICDNCLAKQLVLYKQIIKQNRIAQNKLRKLGE